MSVKVGEQGKKKVVGPASSSRETEDHMITSHQPRQSTSRTLIGSKINHKLNSRDIEFSVSNNMASVKDSLCLVIDLEGFRRCAKEISRARYGAGFLTRRARLTRYQEVLKKQSIASNIVKQQQSWFLSGSLCMETMKGRTQRRELSNPACSTSSLSHKTASHKLHIFTAYFKGGAPLVVQFAPKWL